MEESYDCDHGEGHKVERAVASGEVKGPRGSLRNAPGHYGFAQATNADVPEHY